MSSSLFARIHVRTLRPDLDQCESLSRSGDVFLHFHRTNPSIDCSAYAANPVELYQLQQNHPDSWCRKDFENHRDGLARVHHLCL